MYSPEIGNAPRIADAIAYLEERLQRADAALALSDASAQAAAADESLDDVQTLLALAIRLYVSNYHAGREVPIFRDGNGVSATDVMIASTEMLKAVNVQLFELGMFQTWSRH
ncbi:MAG TPA: hypothetical protein VGN04_00755 [Herbaspirillum sp.]|jgi:hypothetical protein